MAGGLNGALNTSLNGLTLNETAISVLGNNIANAGTVGFKASTVLFKSQLSQTLTIGSAPTAENGGTNPQQIGLGAAVAAIRKDFSQGGITTTNNDSDLAIQGEGFFILNGPTGPRYTRNGSFTLDKENKLVNAQGLRVQGYGVDANYNIVESATLTDLVIPIGSGIVAQRTQTVSIGGSLLSTSVAELGTQGTLFKSEALQDTTGSPITASTLLKDVRNSAGDALFTVGEVLAFTPKKGGRELDPFLLPTDNGNPISSGKVSNTTTVQDLLNLLQYALGIHTSGVPNDAGQGVPPGVTVTSSGEIQVLGNTGTANAIDDMDMGRLTSNSSAVDLDFGNKLQMATGESATTDLVIYDSLGEAIDLRVTVVLEAKVPTKARYYIESVGDSRVSTAIATGTIQFDSNGNVLESDEKQTVIMQRDDTNAFSPMSVTIDFSSLKSISPEEGSSLTSDQDGFPPGTLVSFGIDEKGIINGAFNNGENRPLGQIVLARFKNPQGLLENGEDTYVEGVSSGKAELGTPGSFSYGTILGGSIELSNADIGRSLVDLIVAATNYRGNARIISAVQQLVDELLLLGR
ncbi:MAG: flagellar hook-basal body complex protein [Planctomycetes bacterium]|nr:flagellar hook-basal body complex protein [Planctomycetota bacterium]